MISWSPSSCSFDFRYGTEAVWKLLLEIEIFFRNNEIHLWEAVNYIFKNELNVITKVALEVKIFWTAIHFS